MKTKPYYDTYTQDNYKASFAQSHKQSMRKKRIDKKQYKRLSRQLRQFKHMQGEM